MPTSCRGKVYAFLLLPLFSLTCAAYSIQDAQDTQRPLSAPQTTATDAQSNSGVQENGSTNTKAAAVPRPVDEQRAAQTKIEDEGTSSVRRGLFPFETPVLGAANSSAQNAPKPGATASTPLTGKEKMHRAFTNAFLNPESYLLTGVGAAITEYSEDDLPHKDNEDRFADFGTRWAIRFTTRTSGTILGSGVFPVLFKQDPRYEPAGKKPFFKRALHAASRVFVTRDDDGNLEPNYSRWAGSLASSALSNLWEQSTPGHDRIGADATFRRFGYSFTSGMVNNIVREFLPDLLKKFRN
jgi:hypothetical protein